MARVKRGTTANKRRKNLLEHTKGFRFGRKNKYKLAKEAMLHAWTDSFNSRRKKKGTFRRLWQVQIGAATRIQGVPYNRFINGLLKQNIDIDRKILAGLAQDHQEVFNKLVEMSQQAK